LFSESDSEEFHYSPTERGRFFKVVQGAQNKAKKKGDRYDMQVFKYQYLKPVLEIRSRIRMFLGLPDPDPLVRCMDLDPSLFFIKVLSRLK
jgi:hypothetical protein